MTSITTKCDEVLSELAKFSEYILSLGESITDNRIGDLEKQIGYTLPKDFKYIMTKNIITYP
jgi:hypothetical protein